MYIKNPQHLYNELFPLFIEKYFKNISNKRLNEIQQKILIIIEDEYNKIKKNNLPIWENIKSNMLIKIKEIINLQISAIFNGKIFRDEVDPNLGRKDAFYNIIPLDIKENPLIKKEKQKEMKDIIEKEVDNSVLNFNKLREKLPLFNENLGNIISEVQN